MKQKHGVYKLVLPNSLSSLLVAERVVESICQQAKTCDKDASAIVLATSEALCNIIEHGLKSAEEQEINLQISLIDNTLNITINDEGVEMPSNLVKQYHDRTVALPALDVDLDDLPNSGWGVNILLMTAKNVRYTRTSTGNQLELEFQIA